MANIHADFTELNSLVKLGDTVNLEVKLNRPATRAMSFEIVPVGGDARIGMDVRFLDSQRVNFAVGERTKTVRVEILHNSHDLDQLLALRLDPVGGTALEEVGPRNLHNFKIKRVTRFHVMVSLGGGLIGRPVMSWHSPGDIVNIDAGTRPGHRFTRWQEGEHDIRVTLSEPITSARNSFVMPEHNVAVRAKFDLLLGAVHASSVALNRTTLALTAGQTSDLTATVQPANVTFPNVFWTSSNPHVASVDLFTGRVTAVSNGIATIRVRTIGLDVEGARLC